MLARGLVAATALVAAITLPAAAQPSWQPEPTPAGPGWLTEAATLDNGDAWAFGAAPTSGGDTSLALRRAAHGSWQRVEVPDVGPIGAVSPRLGSELWAAGADRALHYADGAWKTVPLPPKPEGWQRKFTSMIEVNPGELWLSGTEYRGTAAAHGVVLAWDGTAWRYLDFLPDLGANWGIEEINGGGKQVWAAAWTRTGTTTKPALLTSELGSWSRVDVPAIDGDGWFTTAYPNGTGAVFVAGARMTPGGARALVMHYYLGKWEPVQVPADSARLRTSGYAYGQGGILFAGSHDTERDGYLLHCDNWDNVCRRLPGLSAPAGDVVLNILAHGSDLGQLAAGSVRAPGIRAFVARDTT